MLHGAATVAGTYASGLFESVASGLARVIVLDESMLIAFLDSDDARPHPRSTLLIREVDDDFAVDSLALAEFLVESAPRRPHRRSSRHAGWFKVRNSLPAGAAPAGRASRDTDLPVRTVVAQAEQVDARFAWFDDRLGRVATTRGIEVLDELNVKDFAAPLSGPVQRSACETPSSAVSATTVGSKREMPYWIRLDRAAD